MVYLHKIDYAIKSLHWKHGKGDIQSIEFMPNGIFKITAKCTSAVPHMVMGKIELGKRPYTQRVKVYCKQLTVMLV